MRDYPPACYVCLETLSKSHWHYPDLCECCGEFNYKKRQRFVDLNGYSALITGGRLKVGFETAVRLLRCGARVSITTRFARDAEYRFRRLADFCQWRERLKVYPADFRILASVEDVVQKVRTDNASLDILVNNAAQTIHHPPIFYRHLLKSLNVERPDAKSLELVKFDTLAGAMEWSTKRRYDEQVAALSQLPLLAEDVHATPGEFPEGVFDSDGQQEDRRSKNSWMLTLPEIQHGELLEVLYINVIAPFLLTNRLLSKMRPNGQRRAFVINVSAMEGNFHDPDKSPRHPHTNMAKAALNMMTRTCALGLSSEGILMTSVDPGWITNERPFPLTEDRSSHRTRMAIDATDGAARLCDPIFQSVADGVHLHGVLIKNYSIYPW